MQLFADAQASYIVPVIVGVFYKSGRSKEYAFSDVESAINFCNSDTVNLAKISGLVRLVTLRYANFSLN